MPDRTLTTGVILLVVLSLFDALYPPLFGVGGGATPDVIVISLALGVFTLIVNVRITWLTLIALFGSLGAGPRVSGERDPSFAWGFRSASRSPRPPTRKLISGTEAVANVIPTSSQPPPHRAEG